MIVHLDNKDIDMIIDSLQQTQDNMHYHNTKPMLRSFNRYFSTIEDIDEMIEYLKTCYNNGSDKSCDQPKTQKTQHIPFTIKDKI